MEENSFDKKQEPSNSELSKMGKIVGINLAIFLVQAGLVYGLSPFEGIGNTISMYFGMLMFITLPGQLLFNLVMAIVYFSDKKPRLGASYLLSLLMVFLIGFSVCGGYEILTKGLVN